MNTRNLVTGLLLIFTLSAASGQEQSLASGPDIGKDCPAFDPRHVSGPDKGTNACPMCKYGYQQGVMIWMNTDNWDNISRLTVALEKEIETRGLKRIRVFLMYMNPEEKSRTEVESMLKGFSEKNGLKKVAVTYIPDPADPKTAGLYDINPQKEVRNTVIVYKSRGVFNKIINFSSDQASIEKLITTVRDAEHSKRF